MTRGEFEKQMDRLSSRFGVRHFDPQFRELVARELKDMTDHEIEWICDTFIGSRTANKPPLLSEFREQRLLIEKRKLADAAAKGAAKVLQHPAARPLRELLATDYGKVESATEALEVARLKLKLNETDGDGGAA